MRLNKEEKEKIKKDIGLISLYVFKCYNKEYSEENLTQIINSRKREDVEMKDIIVYLLHDYFSWSHLNITEFFFTCIRATQKSIYKIRGYIKYDPQIKNRIATIINDLSAYTKLEL